MEYQIAALFNAYFTETTSTGSKVLDNSIIAIKCAIVMWILKYIYINWIQLYNCIIYHLYGMKNYPLELWRAPYIYNTITTQTGCDEKLIEHNMNIISTQTPTYNGTTISSVICKLVKKTNIKPLCTPDNNPIITVKQINLQHYGLKITDDRYCSKYGLFIIMIDPCGNPIYYSTKATLYCNNLIDYNTVNYIGNYIFTQIQSEEEEKNDKTNVINMVKFDNDVSISKIGDISKKKTFDTLFYPQKDGLIALLDKFKAKTLYPSHIPMDNKLGILLYGPPGTGKTGTISAIANYLGRSLTIINFSEITTTSQLNSVLDKCEYERTIFVFDEFDCLLDVLGGSKSEEKDEKNDWGTMLLAAEGDERKQILEMMKSGRKNNKNKLDIGYLLQKLDGLETAEDRMIIATTNNPDKINPALLRPGRFDLKLCLGNCTQDMYGKILENYYKGEEDVYNRVLKEGIPDYKYSPLELMNMSMQCESLSVLLEKCK
jgi:hypothetical protein